MLRDPACAGPTWPPCEEVGSGGVPSLGGRWLFDSQCPIRHSAVPQKVMDCWAGLIWVMRGRDEEKDGVPCGDCRVGAPLCRANLCTPVAPHALRLWALT